MALLSANPQFLSWQNSQIYVDILLEMVLCFEMQLQVYGGKNCFQMSILFCCTAGKPVTLASVSLILKQQQ